MKILLAVDGSDYSRYALNKGAEIAAGMSSELLVLTVSNLVSFGSFGPLGYGPDTAVEVPSQEEVATILQEAESFLASRGLQARTLTRVGGYAETILAVAEEEQTDLIIMGSHGRSGLQRFLLGSVSMQVMNHAPCSVLIAKGPQASKPEEDAIAIPATHVEKM